jgi:diphthamide biosynthesis protein 2
MAPPRIMFDDGSRVMHAGTEALLTEIQKASASTRGETPIETYYETIRTAEDAVDKLDWTNSYRAELLRSEGVSASETDGFTCHVALQFPDELLSDASQVTWLMEKAIKTAYNAKFKRQLLQHGRKITPSIQQHLDSHPLVFILGDSTYGSCCPDEVAAQHLNADVLIHYGYACLSGSSERIPVVYAFGVASTDSVTDTSFWSEGVRLVAEKINESANVDDAALKSDPDMSKSLLLLYDLKYHHTMGGLREQLETLDGVRSVVLGSVPEQRLDLASRIHNVKNGCCSNVMDCSSGTSCGNEETGHQKPDVSSANSCCQTGCGSHDIIQAGNSIVCCKSKVADHDGDGDDKEAIKEVDQNVYIPRSIGGLVIPDHLDLSRYTLLYIGDDLNINASNSNNQNTRLFHILLRCSASDGCVGIWSYSPVQHSLNCQLLESQMSSSDSITFSTFLSRTLRRRYVLIEKAKMATTIGILIGTTTTSPSFRLTLSRIRKRIQSTGRTAYTFAVGKLATASSKVSNFAEIDCFVLIACQETIAKFWRMEREDMVVPVITPLELDVALGLREWDGRYSCDFGDLVRWDKEDGLEESTSTIDDSINNGDDQPFFSMISGQYESSRAPKHRATNLQEHPGQGQIMEYRSEAAEFLKQRQYQGLEANVGQTEAKAAVLGKAGIASNYGEDL